MTGTVTILFDVKRGALRIDNLPALTRWLQAHEGQRGRAVFETTDLPKRAKLEKFYRYVLLVKAGEHEGNDLKDQHRVYWHHLTDVEAETIAGDLAKLSDDLLSRYVQDCVRLAATNGCLIGERT